MIAVRAAFQSLVVVFGGVVADRLPRNLVLVGASLIQGVAQAATAALVLSGAAEVWSLVVLSIVYGVGGGVVIPAEVGLVPQTVSSGRLQEANALLGLAQNVVGVLGPALGGALLVAGSPGTALALDAVTFFVAAALLATIRLAPRVDVARASFLRELRDGWREFTAHTWLWSTVLLFGISNLVFVGAWAVLGPLVAKEEYGGAGAWAVVLAAAGVGSIAGGLVALRYRPRRPLLVSCLVAWPLLLELAALAVYAPLWLLATAAFVTGAGIALHLALWFTVFQREVPEHARSRVSSYDALGSFVLIPVGMAVAGPTATAIGVQEAIWCAFAISFACQLAIVLIPSVRALGTPGVEPRSAA